jgi:hypothetical protein
LDGFHAGILKLFESVYNVLYLTDIFPSKKGYSYRSDNWLFSTATVILDKRTSINNVLSYKPFFLSNLLVIIRTALSDAVLYKILSS